jgi:hypothetical protein
MPLLKQVHAAGQIHSKVVRDGSGDVRTRRGISGLLVDLCARPGLSDHQSDQPQALVPQTLLRGGQLAQSDAQTHLAFFSLRANTASQAGLREPGVPQREPKWSVI